MAKESFDLNPQQLEAVSHKDGPLLVVAGAGTGKTRVITERIAKLVRGGVAKNNILALTFTEKAAQEMLDRTSESLTESYGVELNIFTYNAFGHELLSEFAVEIGLSSNLKLIGDNGKVVLLREHLDELGLDYFAPISRPDGQLKDLGDYFSRLKQQLVSADAYLKFAVKLPSSNEQEKLNNKRHQELAAAFKKYLEITKSKNIIDYDDQLYLLVSLLEERPNVLEALQERYKFIMVDEFQDTNPMQSRLLDLLAGARGNIMTVGDDDQSIYGWRGATLANILEFTKRYKDTKQITLIENYRSTQAILDASYKLIQHNNPDRLEVINKLDKKLHAARGAGIEPQFKKFARQEGELSWVAQDIKKKLADGVDPGQIAVLARSKNTVSKVHQMLSISGIDHSVAGITEDMYRHPIVATMLEALRCVVAPSDNRALYHTLGSTLFSCDALELSQAAAAARAEHRPLLEILSENSNEDIKKAVNLIKKWQQAATDTNVRVLAYDIITDTGLKDRLLDGAEKSIETDRESQVLGQWFNSLQDFEQVSSLPSALSYIDNLDALMADGETIGDDSVNIISTMPSVMTVHKAKGLEWQVVYVVDLTEKSFPLTRRGNSLSVPPELSKTTSADDHYNEERRLMYVAATRARNQLILTRSESHNGITRRKPSRFLAEMSDKESEETPVQESLIGLDFGAGNNKTDPIDIPAKLRQNGNLVLSASQADDYLRCGLNFYCKHILNMPEAPTADTVVGSMFHDIIQEISEHKVKALQPIELKAYLKRLESDWPAIGYSSIKQRERALELGLSSFKTLYERLLAEPNPVAIEKPFRVHLPGSKLILKGRIDAVVPVDGGVQIRDYKTSTSVNTAEKAKSRTQSSDQLIMYALAWRLTQGEDPLQVALDFVQTGQMGVVKKRPDSLDKMEAKLGKAAADILDGKFPPGAKHDFCIHSPVGEG